MIPWRLVISQIRINKKIARIMLLTGLPLGVQSAAYSISNIIAQADINAFGVDAATGWGLGARIDGIIWQSADALGVAVTAFSAQNFGARRYDRMRQGVKVSTALSLVLVGVFSILVFARACAPWSSRRLAPACCASCGCYWSYLSITASRRFCLATPSLGLLRRSFISCTIARVVGWWLPRRKSKSAQRNLNVA